MNGATDARRAGRAGLALAVSVIAIAGEWGTLSEAAFCRKFGIPVIGLAADLPQGVLTETAEDPAAAVARAVELAQAGRYSG